MTTTTPTIPEHLAKDLVEIQGLIAQARREVAEARGEPTDLLSAVSKEAMDLELLVNSWLTLSDDEAEEEVVCLRHAAMVREMRVLGASLRRVVALVEGQ